MDFWDIHGILFCICIFFFPRLTMLFATAWGGCLWWFGWLLAPRLTVAILATFHYWDTNPGLCVFVWIWAFAGESAEKKKIKDRND